MDVQHTTLYVRLFLIFQSKSPLWMEELSTKKETVKKCQNCEFWDFHAQPNLGLCKRVYMAFAYTCERTLHPITKSFYVCDEWRKNQSKTEAAACSAL